MPHLSHVFSMACKLEIRGMLKNYLTITLRSLLKHKLPVLANILGMGVAVGCCMVAYFAQEYNVNYDMVHKNGQQIYRVTSVREFEGKLTRYGLVPTPVGTLVGAIPDVNRSTRFDFSQSNFKRDNDVFNSNLRYVDPDFFDMFTFDFIAGSPKEIQDRRSILVSEEVATRLFGNAAEAVGKTVTIVYGTQLKDLKVGGVFRDPQMNSSFYVKNGSSFVHYDNRKDEFPTEREDDWRKICTVFVQINDPGRVSTVHDQLSGFVARANTVSDAVKLNDFTLEQLPGMAIRDRLESTEAWTFVAPPQAAVFGTAVMGFLMLLVACFNLTNTTIAMSASRLKEIGIRKVMGSRRIQLIIQLMSETLVVCIVAAFVGLAFAELFVSGWNSLWEYMQLTPHYFDSLDFFIFLTGVLILAGLLAGSYPALYVSRFAPVKILKGKLQFGGTSYLTKGLLTVQFIVSLIAVVSAMAFYQNANYQRTYDLGFNSRGSIVAHLDNKGEFDTYQASLESNADIQSMAGAKSSIFAGGSKETVRRETAQLEVDMIEVGDHYLETLNLQLIAGRDFVKDSPTDIKESVIVSQRLAEELGMEGAIGERLIWHDTVSLYVVGVVKNIYTRGLWMEMEPMMIRYVAPENYRQLIVSTAPANLHDVNESMKASWNKLFPNRLYNGTLLTKHLDDVDEANSNLILMYAFTGIVALLHSLTGLFTLMSINIIRRTKEIGIRKVLGASILHITKIVNLEFGIILTIAAIIGGWAGYTTCNALMGTIWKYYLSVTTSTVVTSISLVVVLAALAVAQKVYRIASMNPTQAIKEN